MTLIRGHDGCTKAYSEGLRKKTVQAVEERGTSKADAARTFEAWNMGPQNMGTWGNMGLVLTCQHFRLHLTYGKTTETGEQNYGYQGSHGRQGSFEAADIVSLAGRSRLELPPAVR